MNVHTKLWLTHNKNKIFTGAIVILAIAALVWTAQPPSENPGKVTNHASTSNSSLKAAEDSFDFGTISMAAGKVNHTFAVRNAGIDPLTVKKLYTSCMCTTASMLKDGQTYGPFGMPMHGPIPEINQTLAPGQEVPIEITFDPAAHGPAGVGRISRVVYLDNNAGTPLELKFNATVTP